MPYLQYLQYLQYLLCQDPSTGLLLWLALHCVAGYMLVIQKTTTHHGPELYHAGDTPRQVTKQKYLPPPKNICCRSVTGACTRWTPRATWTSQRRPGAGWRGRWCIPPSVTCSDISTIYLENIYIYMPGNHLLHHLFPAVDHSKVRTSFQLRKSE